MKKRVMRTVLAVTLAFSLAMLVVPVDSQMAHAATETAQTNSLTVGTMSKAPGRVKITSVAASQNTVTVKYQGVKGAKKYQVAYKPKSSKTWKKITNKKKLTRTIKSLAYSTKYQIKVRAYNGKWGKWSKVKNVTTTEKGSAVKLTSLTSISGRQPTIVSPYETAHLTDNYGNKYKNAIISYATDRPYDDKRKYEYLINSSRFSRFKGKLYVPQGQSSIYTCGFTVKGDGRVLYTSPMMTKLSKPHSFNVNILGCSHITIEWSYVGESYPWEDGLTCCIANPRFCTATKGDAVVDKAKLPIDLLDLVSIDTEVRLSSQLIDNHDGYYVSALYNRVDYGHRTQTMVYAPVFEYLLDSRYSRFTGTLYVPKGQTYASASGIRMWVVGDGKTLYESPIMSATSLPIDFEVDISGCNDVKICFSNYANSASTGPLLNIAKAYLYQ